MKIKVNGEEIKTNLTNLYELKKKFCSHDENWLVMYQGFHTKSNYILHEGDEIFFIKKGEQPSKQQWEAMVASRYIPNVYEKIKKAHVGIAGLGGLGSSIAMALARTGVGHLHLVDMDDVDLSNLNRQQYRISHLGMAKTEALQQQIAEVNPFVTVTIDTIKVTSENAKDLFVQDEIVCEAFDNPDAKAMLVNCLLEHTPYKTVVASSGMAGYESSNTILTKRVMKNLYLCGDGKTEIKLGQGLIAPRVWICAGHQANMVLRLIVGEEVV